MPAPARRRARAGPAGRITGRAAVALPRVRECQVLGWQGGTPASR